MGPKKKKVLWPFSSSRRKKPNKQPRRKKKVKDSLRKRIAMETKKVFDSILPRPWKNKKNKIKSFQENVTFLNQNVVQLVENRKAVEERMSKLARSFDRTQQDMASLKAATATQSYGPTRIVGGSCVGTSPDHEKRFERKVFE